MIFNLDFRKHVTLDKDDKLTRRVRLFTGYLCNYDCGFCFYKGNKPKPYDQEIRNQALIAREYGIDSLDISGGEPTILRDWFSILSYLKKDLKFKNLAAITNGSTFADRDFLERSMEYGLNEVLFSYHGPSESIHDQMTNKIGSYRRLCSAINNAIDLGIKIRINTVVTGKNYMYLPMIANDIISMNPICFNFLPFRLENESTPDNMISYNESVKFIKEAIDKISSKNIFISVRYIPFCVMKGYEKYVCDWTQKLFDPFEWSQHIFTCLEDIRLDRRMSNSCFASSKSRKELEFTATFEAIKSTCRYIEECSKCSHKWICEGVWYSYFNFYDKNGFQRFNGEDINDILYYRRDYMKSLNLYGI